MSRLRIMKWRVAIVLCCVALGGHLLTGGLLRAGVLWADSPEAVSPATETNEPNLIAISWDGAADWVVDRLLADGGMPNLASMVARGARAEHSVSSIPSKTAVAHAALWTGCWGDCNGITGNFTPLLPTDEHSPLERRRGFDSRALRAEPLFVTAAKAGRSVAVLSATQNYPPEPHVETLRRAGVDPSTFRAFSGFEHRLSRSRVLGREHFEPVEGWPDVTTARGRALEATLSIAGEPFFVLAFDDPAIATDGYDRLIVRQGARGGDGVEAEARLTPRSAGDDLSTWSSPFDVSDGTRVGTTYFRLFELEPDGSAITLYQRPAHAILGAAGPGETEAYRMAYRGFYDQAFGFYRRGGLGATLVDDGTGVAEERLLEVLSFDTQLLINATRWAIETWRPELVFNYAPYADGAGHTWMGLLDEASPRYDRALAARLWPYYAEVYGLLDRWLGEILELAGDDTVVALVSDHGMRGVGPEIGVNAVLEGAGLLVRNADGSIDLGRTRALMPPWGDFFLIVHDQRWPTGIVKSDDRAAVLNAAREALLGAVDPVDGRHLIARVLTPEEFPALGLGGEAGGDLYFDPTPGYTLDQSYFGGVVKPMDEWGSGDHGFLPESRSMHAIFFVSGPGVRRGVEIPPIRHIDVAPTLSRLIGIPNPASARGRVLYELLDEDGDGAKESESGP